MRWLLFFLLLLPSVSGFSGIHVDCFVRDTVVFSVDHGLLEEGFRIGVDGSCASFVSIDDLVQDDCFDDLHGVYRSNALDYYCRMKQEHEGYEDLDEVLEQLSEEPDVNLVRALRTEAEIDAKRKNVKLWFTSRILPWMLLLFSLCIAILPFFKREFQRYRTIRVLLLCISLFFVLPALLIGSVWIIYWILIALMMAISLILGAVLKK